MQKFCLLNHLVEAVINLNSLKILVSTVTYINLIPQDQFDVGVLNGEIQLKSGVDSNGQYNLYLSSFDGGSDGLLSE